MSDMISRVEAAAICDEHSYSNNPYVSMRMVDAAREIRALPAYEVGVTHGEIERAVWEAMGWALRHAKQLPGDIIPPYTDGGNSDAETECRRAAARIRSALTATPAQDVAGLVEAVEALNAACDAMWNDHERIEKNPSRFGQPYQLKEKHIKAISEAQQKLPAALARMKEAGE